MAKLGSITRRAFIVASAAVAGGVVFGYWKYKQPYGNPLETALTEGEAALTPYVLIDQDGISIVAPRAEMGQGVHTTLAAMVAEELDVKLAKVKVMHGPASAAYFNAAVLEDGIPFTPYDTSGMANTARSATAVVAKFLGMQITGGSSSVADAFDEMRTAGAAARQVLLLAAAEQLGVSVEKLRTENGFVVDPAGNMLAYTELAVAAAKIDPPSEPRLKPQSDWKILGKSQERVDVVAKSTGQPIYGIDVELEGMLHASIKVNPRLGAPMNSYDAAKALTMPGVQQILKIDNGVAVIASNTWYAFQALKAIKFDWAQSDYPSTTEDHFNVISAGFDEAFQDSQLRDDGDIDSSLENADQIISAEYRVPYLAHAAMEPISATAHLKDGVLEIWAGNQIPTQVIKDAAELTGLDKDKIKLHNLVMGGSFGRRLELNFISQTIQVAQALEGTPVKLTWSREEDTSHDYYRPQAIAKFQAVADDKGPSAINLQLAAASVSESQMRRLGISVGGSDMSIVQAAWDQPYAVENFRVTGYKTPNQFPISSWRSVGASQNGFFMESMMDEIAHAQQLDPLQMRVDLISHEPSRKVLETVREMSGWGRDMPSGHALGVAYSMSFGVPAAEVIEIAIINDKVKIINVWAAVDVGIALDPRNIEAQVSGGINFGLAAAIMGEITIENGEVQQTNFHTFNSIRMSQSPYIEVRILENGDKIKGIGEPGVPPAAPALANAIFAASGNRIRELPLNKHIGFV